MAPVGRFAPPLALMALIFALSAQEDLSSGLGTADLVLRKLAHMAEFGLLFLLWLRALDRPARPVLAAVIAVTYAASDEWHQSFVDGRHGSGVDVLIDATGVAVAYVFWRAWADGRLAALRLPRRR